VKRSQKELRSFVQAGTSLHDQLLSDREKRLQGGFVNRHPDKFSLEGLPYVLQSGLQEFVRWTIVAQDVCEKCLVESVADPFIRKQVLDIEQIPRMLSVKGSNQFPRVQISKRNDLDSAKPNRSSTIGRTVFNSTGWTVPRRTGVTSILIWAFL
jgi:hypothetical protein